MASDIVVQEVAKSLSKKVMAKIDLDSMVDRLAPKVTAELEKAILSSFSDFDSYDLQDFMGTLVYDVLESKEMKAKLSESLFAAFNIKVPEKKKK